MFFNTIAVASGLVAVASAHMDLAFPLVYTAPAVTNGPITYGNFPCQSTAATYGGPTNTMSLGSDQPLKFLGQSVHGGGSCQVSITYDENPTRDSVWKVIKSFAGGCPARNTAGNLGDDTSATAPDPYTYNFTVPDNIPSGKGTLAWTWINKVGNREFYMQCAGIELAGTSGDQSNYDALPDMFVANLGGSDTCTVGSGDFIYPDPGSELEYGNGAIPSGADVATTAGSCTVGVGGSGSGSVASSVATTTEEAATATPDSGAAAGGVFATSNAAAPTVAASTSEATVTPAATTAAPVVPVATAASGSSSSSSSSGSAQSGACSTDGDYVCLGETYQVCASGAWSVAMPLASGTQCSGTGSTFAIAAASKQKSKFRRSREERRKRGLGAMFGMP